MSEAARRWSLRTAQVGDPGAVDSTDPATADDPAANVTDPTEVGLDLPVDFATKLGAAAVLNYTQAKLQADLNDYNVPVAQAQALINQVITKARSDNKVIDPAFQTAVRAGGKDPNTIRAVQADFIALFGNLKQYNQQQVQQAASAAVLYCPEPTNNDYTGGQGDGQKIWLIGQRIQVVFNQEVQALKQAQTPASQFSIQPAARAPVVVPASADKWTITAQAPQQGPLAQGKYQSVSQLRDELISMGPSPETYERIMALVGPDREDDAKEALGSFFQGLAASLCTLYDMLVDVGMASPIDAEIVEKLMSQHPELSEENPKAQGKAAAAGLFLPPTNSGMYTKTDRLQKTAGGGVGGAGAGYPAYEMYGPGDTRMCPKIRQPVSTFICRYHCLDGINIDDGQVLCGEAIWRQAVMDKFSREYRDADGKWVGGYLNKRFETHYDDGGHPALLKPGERMQPIHEDAWSIEKRLMEVRKTESGSRGYSETPGDGPKDLYNFDQHDLKKGPKNPQLTEKNKDKISRAAESDSMFEKTAADEKKKPWTVVKQKPGFEPSKKDLDDVGVKPPKEEKKPWPPADGDTPFDGPKKPKKAFNLAQIKRANSGEAWAVETIVKEAWGLKAPNSPGADFGGDKTNGMGENVNHGKIGKRCPRCKKIFGENAAVCDACGTSLAGPNANYNQGDALRATHSVDNAGMIPAASDAEIVLANGVYRATKEGISTFGETAEEAIEKLARGLADTRTPPIADEAAAISNFRSMDDDAISNNLQEIQHPVANPIQAGVPDTNVPPPAPMAKPDPALMAATEEKVKPASAGVPLSNRPPDESQGPSEFFKPEVVPSTGMNVSDENEGWVNPKALDQHLQDAAARSHPEEQRQNEAQAVASGAHP